MKQLLILIENNFVAILTALLGSGMAVFFMGRPAFGELIHAGKWKQAFIAFGVGLFHTVLGAATSIAFTPLLVLFLNKFITVPDFLIPSFSFILGLLGLNLAKWILLKVAPKVQENPFSAAKTIYKDSTTIDTDE